MNYDSFPPGMLAEIEAFLAADKSPPGLDFYPELFATGTFFPLQRQAEMAAMMRLARSRSPRVVCELGADKGGSVWSWAKCLPTVEFVIACEIRGCPYQNLFSRAFPRVSFAWMERASLPPPYLPVGMQIDVLFIDGDKSAFEADFDAYLPLMNPAGLVFMHDVCDGGPREAFRRVARQGYATHEIIDRSDAVAALDRQRQGIPPASPHEGWLRFWQGRSATVGVIELGGKAS